ncbi:subtilisin-like protease SBT5.4 [Arachis duranensis]|uniref:Subtilisin-like protease SBT5.4 n=1 Tax=Arachis duranensis TaxID=130453 RepID=A0A9C6TFY7_ARADU|nr:subtilisin-like protease SBT5.4 [Arachis duranensis]
MASSTWHVMLSLLLCFLLHQNTQAIKQSYIVYMGSHSFGQNSTLVDAEYVTNSHHNLLGSYVGSVEKAKEAIFYSYNKYINGFAAVLDEEEAAKIAKHPEVLSVFPNKPRQLHTTYSWSFLGLETNGAIGKQSIWKESLGQDVIIANLDTGVWPESKSFSDEGMGPIPKRWRGICQVDEKNLFKFHCNRKLIGARYFNKGYIAALGQIPFNTTRDYEGHGTHTLSTAGGNFVHGANVFGNGNGTASGGSPKARVASYKVCWPPTEGSGGCYDADILAAFEAAISDGVDVISLSVGSDIPSEFNDSAISIGSFHAAAQHAIPVIASAGNNGPSPSTVSNFEPWIFTVAASTLDRAFTNHIILGNKRIRKGASLSESVLPYTKFSPLISAADAKLASASELYASQCQEGTLDPKKAKGKIVFCVRGGNSRLAKGIEAARVGATGMILANQNKTVNDVEADPHLLPSSHVHFNDGQYVFSYINRTKYPVASISRVGTQLGVKPAPFVATFSSRGPSPIEPSILKPDVTAPGVDIIAAYSEGVPPSEEEFDKRRTPFVTMSGTSMSCPHVAGVVGLLKSLHPHWSPAAIKSAIMTTAKITDNTGRPMLDSATKRATPFAYGAGHIVPNRAAYPGLIYDLSFIDYVNFLCGHGYTSLQIRQFIGKKYICPKEFDPADFNYPSITVSNFANASSSRHVTRTVTNVGSPSTYKVRVKAPPQVDISVDPKILRFKRKGEKKTFTVTFTLRPVREKIPEYTFGSLEWTDGKNHVRSPIVIKHPLK